MNLPAPLPKTMVHVLNDRAAQLRDRPALWSPRKGHYAPTSWRQYAQRVRHFSLGLMELGLQADESMGIIGFNREEWVVAELGAMAAGAVAVGLYTTSSPDQLAYILGHCDARIVLVENAKYLETLQALRDQLPKLQHVVVMDAPASLPEGVLTYAEVLARGAAADEKPYWDRLSALKPESLGTLIYTSGTTGHPKGVMLSHENLVWTAERIGRVIGIGEDDTIVSYLPLSHIAEQICSVHAPIFSGMQVFFAESLEKLPDALKRVRPTTFFGVPRVWEKFKAKAEEGLASQPPRKQRIVRWARRIALERNRRLLEHELVPLTLEAQYQVARVAVFEPLKERIGLDRARMVATSAAPIGIDVLEFFASLDIVIHEVYGQSEVTGPTTISTPDATRFGKLGRPMLGVEVKIAEDGEVCVRGGNVCMGYYRDPEATAALIQEGWLRSGDVGEFDELGFLKITGRKKEIIVTSGGKKTAPSNIESLLRTISPVGQAVVIGDNRNYLIALLTLDPDKLTKLAAEKGWPADAEKLADHAELRRHLSDALERDVHPQLSKFESIKKFAILPRDFSIEGGELTATLKIRRKIVEAKYAALIESLYAEGARERAS